MIDHSTTTRLVSAVLLMVVVGCQGDAPKPNPSSASETADEPALESKESAAAADTKNEAAAARPEGTATGQNADETVTTNASASQEMTAAELERTLQSIPNGKQVRVKGVIESIPYVNRKLLTGEAVHSIRLYGYYSEPLNKGLSCAFSNAEDLLGLTEEQEVVVEGTVIRGRRSSTFADCKLISKGEMPEYAPVPFETGGQPPLATLSPPAGVEIASGQGYLSIEKEAIAADGTLPGEIIETLGPRPEFGTVTVTGSISTAGLKQIAGLHGMKRLQLFDHTNLETLDFSVLAEHPRLRSIWMKGIAGFTSEHLRQIGQLRCLAWLKVEGDFGGLDLSKVDDVGLTGLASLKSLRWLELEPKHKGEPTKITDNGLAALAELPRLQVLDLWSKSLDGSGFASLKSCPELHTLLLGKSSVTSDGMKSLESLPKLAVLSAADTDLDVSFASTVEKLALLRQLNLSKSKITDDFFKRWGSPANLTHLTIKSSTLTDAGIKALCASPPPQLRYLGLDYNKQLTKACIGDLKQIKTLETLTAPRSFDKAAKDELKQAIPDLKVY